jgi:hypothetical protein
MRLIDYRFAPDVQYIVIVRGLDAQPSGKQAIITYTYVRVGPGGHIKASGTKKVPAYGYFVVGRVPVMQVKIPQFGAGSYCQRRIIGELYDRTADFERFADFYMIITTAEFYCKPSYCKRIFHLFPRFGYYSYFVAIRIPYILASEFVPPLLAWHEEA